jgi:2-iminobutanoate/2-iminopropanoate deaminase
MKEKIISSNAPAAIGPYSQAIKVGNTVYCSGQIPLNPESGEIVGNTITEQAEQVFKNISGLLKDVETGAGSGAGPSAGTSLDAVVKTTCFLADMNDFVPFNEVYAKYFTDPYPARSAVAVKTLPKNVLVEVEVIAIVGVND